MKSNAVFSVLTAVMMNVCVPPTAVGQTSAPSQSAKRPATSTPGYQGMFIAGFNLPSGPDSFAASGLDERSLELGGGIQTTNVWRNLFVQLNASRWQQSGERVFIDSTGARYPLGIPLDVRATFIDVSAGWRIEKRGSTTQRLTPFGGGGIGMVLYREKSPFAVDGDDLDDRFTSYHAFGGVEIGVTRWISVAGDFRYRFVPGVLGEAGTSSVIGDDAFNGGALSVRLVVGSRGRGRVRGDRERRPGTSAPPYTAPMNPAPSTPTEETKPLPGGNRPAGRGEAIVNIDSGVFVLPDANRSPLRILQAGTRLKVLEATDEWLKVEFNDRQWGARVGYILRRNCSYREPR